MNMVLAVALLTGLFMVQVPEARRTPTAPAVIGFVHAGFAGGQGRHPRRRRIVRDRRQGNPTWEDVAVKEVASAGPAMDVTVERDGKRIRIDRHARLDERSGVGMPAGPSRPRSSRRPRRRHADAEKAGLQAGRPDRQRQRPADPLRAASSTRSSDRANGKPVDLVYWQRDGEHSDHGPPAFSASCDGPERWMIGVQLEPRSTSIPPSCRFPEALRESVRQNAQGRHADLPVPAGHRRAAHVAEIAGRPHPHRPAFRRSRARRPGRLHHA